MPVDEQGRCALGHRVVTASPRSPASPGGEQSLLPVAAADTEPLAPGAVADTEPLGTVVAAETEPLAPAPAADTEPLGSLATLLAEVSEPVAPPAADDFRFGYGDPPSWDAPAAQPAESTVGMFHDLLSWDVPGGDATQLLPGAPRDEPAFEDVDEETAERDHRRSRAAGLFGGTLTAVALVAGSVAILPL